MAMCRPYIALSVVMIGLVQVLLTGCSERQEPETDLVRSGISSRSMRGLRGPVKHVVERSYSWSPKEEWPDDVSSWAPETQGMAREVLTLDFDRDGWMVSNKSEKVTADATEMRRWISKHCQMMTVSRRRCVEAVEAKDEIVLTTELVSKNQLVEIDRVNIFFSRYTHYVLDDSGQIVEIRGGTRYLFHHTPHYQETREMNADGRVVHSTLVFKGGSLTETSYQYFDLDPEGNPLRVAEWHDEFLTIKLYEYTYHDEVSG